MPWEDPTTESQSSSEYSFCMSKIDRACRRHTIPRSGAGASDFLRKDASGPSQIPAEATRASADDSIAARGRGCGETPSEFGQSPIKGVHKHGRRLRMASEPRRFEGPGPPKRNKVTVIYQHTTVPSTASLLPRIGLLTGADRGIVCDRVGPRGTGKACADGDKGDLRQKAGSPDVANAAEARCPAATDHWQGNSTCIGS